MEIDWDGLRAAATEAMLQAYAPYSNFPVGAAALVSDGRVLTACNVENASYGVTLCAECGIVSALHATGGGRLVALSCVDALGAPLMPCGRCRQLLWEHGGPACVVDAPGAPRRMDELLPYAFDAGDLADVHTTGAPAVPPRLQEWAGRGSVFVHPDIADGQLVWTAYWERSSGGTDERAGILQEAPTWPTSSEAVNWGRARTTRVIVVDAEGATFWAGEGEPPEGIEQRWTPPAGNGQR